MVYKTMYVLVYRLSFLSAIGYSTAGPLFKDTFAFLSTDFLFFHPIPYPTGPTFLCCSTTIKSIVDLFGSLVQGDREVFQYLF